MRSFVYERYMKRVCRIKWITDLVFIEFMLLRLFSVIEKLRSIGDCREGRQGCRGIMEKVDYKKNACCHLVFYLHQDSLWHSFSLEFKFFFGSQHSCLRTKLVRIIKYSKELLCIISINIYHIGIWKIKIFSSFKVALTSPCILTHFKLKIIKNTCFTRLGRRVYLEIFLTYFFTI
jgi:hypothetical protein